MMSLLALPEGGEWIVILVIVVLLFGAKKLPELTRNAAQAMKEFEKARKGDDEQPAQVTAPQQTSAPQQTAAPQQAAAPQQMAAPQAAPQQASQQAAAPQPQPQANGQQSPGDGSAGRVDLEGGGSQGVGQ